jgi:hypothetical protein
MAARLMAVILIVALFTGCSTPRMLRLDTGQGELREYSPPASTSSKPVTVDAKAFEKALTQWVLTVPVTLLFPQQGRLVRASYANNDGNVRWQSLMSKSFGGICKAGQRRETCLSLLDDVMGLSEWDKLGMGLALSLEPLKESIGRAVENTMTPQLFYTVIATGLISWAVLAANPEPVFTKAAAIISAVLLIYLGVDTFLELVDASRELKRATDRAPPSRSWSRPANASRIGWDRRCPGSSSSP